MSTHDVPGAVAEHHDTLAMGCWAEHADGSLIFVESTEDDRVIYSIFDTATKPVTEYRDAMPRGDFEAQFSFSKGAKVTWVWHDKTPFPWNRIIKIGAKDGPRLASAEDVLTAAERVAMSRRLRKGTFDPKKHEHLVESQEPAKRAIIKRIQAALDELDATDAE